MIREEELYSIMGEGCHGKTGISQTVKAHLWSTYVISRFVYGLETVFLTIKDENMLEVFQNKILRQIQHLPDRTATTAVTSLLGIPPVVSIIHKKLLNLFFSILSSPGTKEYDVVIRQLAVRQIDEKSMISVCRRLLIEYRLPTAYELINNTPTKETWKNMVRGAIHCKVESDWKYDISEKPSLKYINSSALKVGQIHPLYATVRPNIQDIQRAEVKAKVLTGTYTLQSDRSKFNQFEVNPTFGLCLMHAETREHFISECKSLSDTRMKFISLIADILNTNIETIKSLDPVIFTQLCLDCTHPDLCDHLVIDSKIIEVLEYHTRKYIFDIHFKRSKILDNKQINSCNRKV